MPPVKALPIWVLFHFQIEALWKFLWCVLLSGSFYGMFTNCLRIAIWPEMDYLAAVISSLIYIQLKLICDFLYVMVFVPLDNLTFVRALNR